MKIITINKQYDGLVNRCGKMHAENLLLKL
jgi:hypothetical protein